MFNGAVVTVALATVFVASSIGLAEQLTVKLHKAIVAVTPPIFSFEVEVDKVCVAFAAAATWLQSTTGNIFTVSIKNCCFEQYLTVADMTGWVTAGAVIKLWQRFCATAYTGSLALVT